MVWIYIVSKTGFNNERKKELRNAVIASCLFCALILTVKAMGYS